VIGASGIAHPLEAEPGLERRLGLRGVLYRVDRVA